MRARADNGDVPDTSTGDRPRAIARTTMSRSVSTPNSRPSSNYFPMVTGGDGDPADFEFPTTAYVG
ncbi:hypothetical protein [Nonomuraea turcica]|uniref:hypothetical protein n=1 Tax=Nonomuraea sp. G32 TaxID=3067274 RepID=UPI00273CB27F|nr:hypothetical protein [Nonomuraea sp. G32]MDP4511879.1 hypothetical protein [Nonomuraea sp. G32]